MVWLKIDGIQMESNDPVLEYADPRLVEHEKPQTYTLKVKIGDMELEGKMLNEFVVVDDEKLSKAYEHAKELQKAREEAYEEGRKNGYYNGLEQAINILENELEED